MLAMIPCCAHCGEQEEDRARESLFEIKLRLKFAEKSLQRAKAQLSSVVVDVKFECFPKYNIP